MATEKERAPDGERGPGPPGPDGGPPEALVRSRRYFTTRLVHVLTAPVGHLTRPYIVHRSRDTRLGIRAPRRGWERVG